MKNDDLKKYRTKLIGSKEERAVSPVIGVILMVAITVILAAVIAAFVLDLGQGQSANAQAGVDFSEESGNVTITVNTVTRADSLSIQGSGDCAGLLENGQSSATDSNTKSSRDLGTSAGASQEVHFGDVYKDSSGNRDIGVDYICAEDDKGKNAGSEATSGSIQVIGKYDGSENVIAEFEI